MGVWGRVGGGGVEQGEAPASLSFITVTINGFPGSLLSTMSDSDCVRGFRSVFQF